MYLGVDVGGTKTLVAVLNDHGVILEKQRFPTPKKYADFLKELQQALAGFKQHDFKAGAVGVPSTVFDRQHGVGIRFGNLPWRNVPVLADVEKLAACPILVENDAKLAGLSEAMLLKDKYRKVVYLTVSTGIGYSLIENGAIDTGVGDGGGRTIMLEHKGKLLPWEEFASGHAIVERYGKPAHEINDKATWQSISRDLAKGLIHLIAIMQPEVIVIGGSVGTYFERYHQLLMDELKRYDLPMVKLPVLREAQRPEEAVLYGCYDLASQIWP
ncbi:MAG TPA: ROK family protein [Candidatus Saccharimonadales bacterium]|jgi:glucokinase|nr:ROK family protein [Candidatus Saccharimonadales bacterium]